MACLWLLPLTEIASSSSRPFFHAICGLPVELHRVGFPFSADQSVGVDARAFHVAVVGRNAEVIEEEGEHVEALWVVGEEVEDPPVLLDVRLRVGLQGMDQVWELDPVSNEEHREVLPTRSKFPRTQDHTMSLLETGPADLPVPAQSAGAHKHR